MDDKKVNHYLDRLAINIDKYVPYVCTEEQDEYGNTNISKYVNEFSMSGVDYELIEIDYPAEYVVTLQCKDFALHSTQYDRHRSKTMEVELERGDMETVRGAFTLMQLIHPEYLEDD